MDACAYFKDKKITVMGLGLLGRGAGDAEYLASCGADLIVTDLASKRELEKPLQRLAAYANIRYRLGKHRRRDFRGRDLILKGAGVPTDSPYIAAAQRSGIPVRMSGDLFAELAGIPIVGVTGTRGKTTTTCLIKAILDEAGRKALLGGNIRGVSSLALLPDATKDHVAVMELDAWQMRGFGACGMSPHIAVFTTFYPDHLGYYHGDLEAYFADKAHIFLNQSAGDTLILGQQAVNEVASRYPEQAARAILTSPDDIAGWNLAIPGMHNRANAASARAACLALGIDEEVIRRAVETFPGVEGRLELVREIDTIRIYNDAQAIIPEATCAALRALADAPIILIMGGEDKGSATEELAQEARAAKRVVLLAGSGTRRIMSSFPDAPVHRTLEDALADAMRHAIPGDVVLFSPAFSSRGMFRDAYERADRFAALVASL